MEKLRAYNVNGQFDPIVDFFEIYEEYPNITEFYDISVDFLKEFQCKSILKEYKKITGSDWGKGSFYHHGQDIPNLIEGLNSGTVRRNFLTASLYLISEKILIFIGRNGPFLFVNILWAKSEREAAQKLEDEIVPFIIKKDPESLGKINLLFQNNNGFYLKSKEIDPSFKCDLALNYGDDFVPIYEKLTDSLKKETKGLYLLSSPPGQGKTSLIKNIINTVKGQKVLFLPPNLADAFSSPAFLPFLSEQNIDLVVTEDAENSLRNRDEASSNAISTILNMTDGILGDILKIKILATFNVDRQKIDPALLRPGRCKFYHEFKPLKPEYADRLLAKLGHPPQGKTMSVAEIYNFGMESGFSVEEKRSMNMFGA